MKQLSELQRKLQKGETTGNSLLMQTIQQVRNLQRSAEPRKAAVMILLTGSDNVQIPLIRRPVYEGVHSGQISLPGGHYEPGDMTLEATALRETEEEIGVRREAVEVWGSLEEIYIPPSDILVTPFIGYTPDNPEYIAEKSEVDEIFTLSPLELPVIRKFEKLTPDGSISVNMPVYLHRHRIWGATAVILYQFESVFFSSYDDL